MNNQENSNTNTERTIFWLKSVHLSKNSGRYQMGMDMVLMKISVIIPNVNSFIGNLNRYINKGKSYVSLIRTNSTTILNNIYEIIKLRPRWKLVLIWSNQLLTLAKNKLKSLRPRTWRTFNIIFQPFLITLTFMEKRETDNQKVKSVSTDIHLYGKCSQINFI